MKTMHNSEILTFDAIDEAMKNGRRMRSQAFMSMLKGLFGGQPKMRDDRDHVIGAGCTSAA